MTQVSPWRLSTAALAVVLAAAGCAGTTAVEGPEAADVTVGGDDGDLTTVRVSEVVHSILYTPMYAAVELGYFADEGLELDITTAWSGTGVVAAVIGNQAEVGLSGPEMAVYVANNPEGDANLVTFAQLTNTDGLFLNSYEPREDFEFEDLVGTTIIGTAPGSTPQLVLEYVLAQNGIEIGTDVEVLTNMDATAAAGAFSQGAADFALLSAPSSEDFHAGGHPIVVSMGEEVGPLPYTGFLSNESWLEDNQDIAQAFTNAIYRGMVWTEQATPEEIAEVIHPAFPETDQDTVAAAIDRYKNLSVPIWAATPHPSEEDMETMLDIQEFAGLVAPDERPPFDELFVSHIADAAVEEFEAGEGASDGD